ncbi:SDR family NAD(P)-dependent oxidoreductase [Mycobacterium vicinigordonae]|uniref:3-oxoacyl-[acyl-carrier-protein] reductase MabA n=1 Tax=Mycobacterium vicinigordonae TaxID=1719132 RepID=A0A7D6DXU1_9MYCO|nr:SDR family NAD(P)-dependent oxidoreductase [Mycobacterium vicinigordonae]QLL07487.1 SDR family NAD(P)-dependent oxidoreductase [Mycobacterium vicinigordonae]
MREVAAQQSRHQACTGVPRWVARRARKDKERVSPMTTLIGDLNGKTALITGATKGVGAAIALQFAAAGARVIVSGRHAERGKQVETTIRDRGGAALFVPIDLSIEEQVRTGIDTAVQHYGSLDILVNNAAPTDVVLGGDGAAGDLRTNQLMSILTPGLIGQFWACRYSLPHLIANPTSAIINISAAASKTVYPKPPATASARARLTR